MMTGIESGRLQPVIAVEIGRRDRAAVHIDARLIVRRQEARHSATANSQSDLAIAIVRSAARLVVLAMTTSATIMTVLERIVVRSRRMRNSNRQVESDHLVRN